MSSSRFAAVYDAILTTLRNDANLSSSVISDGLPITEDRLTSLVMIGNSGDAEDTLAGSVRQSYHDMAGTSSTRDETITINCAVMTQTGDVDVSATRSAAFTVLGYVEAALRANYSLGLAEVMRVEVVDVQCYIEQFADGTAVRLPFQVVATCLI